MITLEIEKTFGDVVIGIDEAGRGPLAGGVYTGAVSVPLARAEELIAGEWRGINDSKKLTPKKRDELAEVIKSTPGCAWAIASATPGEIDALNILRATHLAMKRAALACGEKVEKIGGGGQRKVANSSVHLESPPPPQITILVDGLPVPGLPYKSQNVVKGDAKSLLIAAASILAKTARDADCLRLEELYPGYGFAKHKGYPTPEHYAALRKLGPCPEHRRSFGPVAQMELGL